MPSSISRFSFSNGGERETRTLAPVTRSTSLAGTPLHQLGYFSEALISYHDMRLFSTKINKLLQKEQHVLLSFRKLGKLHQNVFD